MEKITFEQIKNLIDQKGGKWIVNTFQDEQSIYHLYNNGWVPCDNYGFHGEEINPIQVLESRTFDSQEQAMSEAEKIGFHVDGKDNLFKMEEIRNLIKNGEVSDYAIFTVLIPTWSELEAAYSNEDFADPESLLIAIEGKLADNSKCIEL